MALDFVQIFKGSPVVIIAVVGAMKEVNITPVVKDPSASAKLARFASMTNEQTLWVHKDEQQRALEVLNSLDL